MTYRLILATVLATFLLGQTAVAKTRKKIVLIAGPITGHGKHTHEYEKNVILLKHLLDTSPNLAKPGLTVEAHFEGWPKDPRTLDTADTIVLISDGGDHKETNHPLYVGDRLKQLQRHMARGCGFVHFHWTTFHPSRFHKQVTEWGGGYFDYEKGSGPRKWYSAIKTWTGPTRLGVANHPISRGVRPFRIQEEFYYRIRFNKKDPRVRPILLTRPPGETQDYVVGWAVHRKNGGRSFGFTGGHFYRNWWNRDYRRLILNAIVWSAGMTVPPGGVQSKLEDPVQVLILTGHNHPAHDWRAVTAALIGVLEQDPRLFVDVTENIEDLGAQKIHRYDLLVMNYSNWDRPGLSKTAKENFVRYLKAGGGLSVIHFANGSFTDTLPNKESDWKEYRTRIVRRIWFHGKNRSGHDAYGPFHVNITKTRHPITAGLKPFRTIDELYFRQEGKLPITPLATARSKVTKKDEPMAFAYPYGKGRIFQTVLGHAAVSVQMGGALIRRGSTWAAGYKPLSFDPPVELTKKLMFRSGSQWSPLESQKRGIKKKQATGKALEAGKFGLALNARAVSALTAKQPAYRQTPFTLECWAKLTSKSGFNILVANELKSSPTHWEAYSYGRTGYFSFYMPTATPAEIKSTTDICDNKWHYLAVQRTANSVKLFVDGKLVKEQRVTFKGGPASQTGLSFGALVNRSITCQGWLDEVRIRKGVHSIDRVPTKPFSNDQHTVGLWHFDKPVGNGLILDRSKLHNSAQLLGISERKTGKTTGHWGEETVGFRWTEDDSKDSRWNQTDVGRFLSATFDTAGGRVKKGLAIRLGDRRQATIAYDTKTMTARAGWHGGFLKFNEARYGIIVHPTPIGRMLFGQHEPAWGKQKVQYRGLYQHGEQIGLEYDVGGVRIRESPQLHPRLPTTMVRRLLVQPSQKPLTLQIFSVNPQGTPLKHDTPLKLDGERIQGQFKTVAVRGQATQLVRIGGKLCVKVLPHKRTTAVTIFVSLTPQASWPTFLRTLANWQDDARSLVRTFQPGPEVWPTRLHTSGFRRPGSGPLVVETIGLPFRNPYRALFFVTGHDFLADGRAVVSTVHGDVWLVSGIDDQLKKITWKRFATGLFQPLGLKVVRNQIYVLGRDQITRLHDRDNNGEADFYESFCNLAVTSAGGHDYVTCLETDSRGNFYFVSANEGLVRVSPDGKRKDIVAAGFRNPNGLGVGPQDQITVAPQEGEWTPASNIALVRPGGWYGYEGPKVTVQRPLGYDPPLIWFPRLFDNSSAAQVWVTNRRWKSLFGQMLHLSFGRCRLQLILQHLDKQSGKPHAALAVAFPFDLDSGVMRGRFNPNDGHLYLSGMKGWVSSAVRDGCLHRVRYTGQPFERPVGFEVVKNGILLRFDTTLDPASANRAGNFLVEHWNYHWSAAYGSPELRVSDSKKIGRDEVAIRSASLLKDGRSIFLEMPVQPVMQIHVNYRVKTSGGKVLRDDLFGTIHSIPNRRIKPTNRGPQFAQLPPSVKAALRPGLECRITQNQTTDTRVSRLLAWFNPSGTPLSPFVRAETARIEFRGFLRVRRPDEYRFFVNASLKTPGALFIGNQVRLLTRGGTKVGSAPIFLGRGYYPVRFVGNANATGAIAARVSWSSSNFIEETIPSTSLFHDSRSARLNRSHSIRRGRQLYAQLNCARCHTSGNQPLRHAMPELQAEPPDLTDLHRRVTRHWLYDWLVNPHSHRPNARMPRVFSHPPTSAERHDIAHLVAYLLPRSNRVDKLRPQNAKLTKLGGQLFEERGCIACHSFQLDGKDDHQRLSLDKVARKYRHDALARFLLQPDKYHANTRMPNFGLTIHQAQALEHHLRSAPQSLRTATIAGDPRLGKKAFAKYRCDHCHQKRDPQVALLTKKLMRPYPKATAQACLATRPTAKSPHFRLTAADRKAILAFLRLRQPTSLYRDSPLEAAQRLTADLRCNACHRRDGRNDLLPAILAEEGTSGRILERAPALTWAGEKLKQPWLEKFLQGRIKDRPRPWLATRMPALGRAYAQALTRGLTMEHGQPPQSAEPQTGESLRQLIRNGNRLTQKAALDCRQCHAMGQTVLQLKNKSNGIGLDYIYDRVRYPFFRRWMHNPLRVDAQTKMPRFAPDGKRTKITGIYGGDAHQQFDALWQYLKSIRAR